MFMRDNGLKFSCLIPRDWHFKYIDSYLKSKQRKDININQKKAGVVIIISEWADF